VLAHEHVFIDIRCWLDETHAPSRHLRDRRVDGTTLAEVRGNPFACLDNLVLDDPELMAAELRALPDGVLVVDVTPQNVGRDVAALARVAEAARVDLLFGCGRYIAESRPGDEGLTVEAYRDEILAEFGRRPRPAVIGEIGTGDPIAESERRAVLGAAQAQAQLGVPLYVHLHPWARHGHEALDLVVAGGGRPDRVVLCHLDPQIPAGLDYHRELMDRGATIAFDIWGDELAYGAVRMPTDAERLAAVVELVGDGYGDRLVHAQDVCTKTQLRAFGGPGYDHIARVVAPMLAHAGLPPHEVHRQLAGNALALLAAP
jgi:phosphotriesterase-related protein